MLAEAEGRFEEIDEAEGRVGETDEADEGERAFVRLPRTIWRGGGQARRRFSVSIRKSPHE